MLLPDQLSAAAAAAVDACVVASAEEHVCWHVFGALAPVALWAALVQLLVLVLLHFYHLRGPLTGLLLLLLL